MASKRQLKEQEIIRKKIVNTAREIMEEKGLEKLSIRSITNRMGYSPGIIYHYFDDKDAIIEEILFESYEKILKAIKIDDNVFVAKSKNKSSF